MQGVHVKLNPELPR